MPKNKSKRKPSECRRKKGGEYCSGKYKLAPDHFPPLFVCNKCGDENDNWIRFYEQYRYLYKQKENWDEPKHKVSCVLGFFLFKYREFYGIDYSFAPKSPNFYGCKEVRDINQLLSIFDGDAHAIRRYIHWVFKTVIRRNTNIISFAYINTIGIIRKYNLYESKKNAITRHTGLPNMFLSWCRKEAPTIFDQYELSTVNDLGALLRSTQHYGASQGSIEQVVLERAEVTGLIKNGKLNIKEQ